jgi:hypothetical protein
VVHNHILLDFRVITRRESLSAILL